MKLREILIDESDLVTYNTSPSPSLSWLSDGHARWLIIEGGTRDEIAGIFDSLGAKGEVIADHIKGENWLERVEHSEFFIRVNASPTAWNAFEKWYHMVVISNIIITIHATEIHELDIYIQRWWLDRPAPESHVNYVLMQIVKMFVSEEVTFFNKFRLAIEKHAEGLRLGDESVTVEQLEAQMTQCQHMTTVFYEYQVLVSSMEHNTDRTLSSKSFAETFRSGAKTIGILRDGVDYMQRRLEELQNQHLMDQQVKTEQRLRILTIVSVIVMPLSLLSGIYGMNFDNMPELHGEYAYFVVMGMMGILAVGMLWFFVVKGWFR